MKNERKGIEGYDERRGEKRGGEVGERGRGKVLDGLIVVYLPM